MNRLVSRAGCSQVFDQIVDIIGEEADTWKEGQPMPLHDTMMKIAINIITKTNFGSHFKNKENSDNLIKNYSSVIDDLGNV